MNSTTPFPQPPGGAPAGAATPASQPGQTAPGRRYRLAFLSSHPIQYLAPLYRHLQASGRFEVTALYLSDFSLRGAVDPQFGQEVRWDIDLLSGYRSIFVGEKARQRSPGGFLSMVAPELWGILRRERFDALVINGYHYAADHVALLAARAAGTAVFAAGDTNANVRRSPVKAAVRLGILRAMYRLYDGAMVVGSSNARHYAQAGVPPERLFPMPHSVDNDRFMRDSALSPEDRAAARARLGLRPDAPAILFLAKLYGGKRPLDLIEAHARLRREGVDAQLVIGGSGPDEGLLKDWVRDHGVPDVLFPGFVNQSAAPALYGACDLFVLPSGKEAWGLVVNEAMCAGLPVIATEECGCSEDLILPGRNGAIYPAGDVDALVGCLRPLLSDPALRAAYGAASRERIAGWGYRQSCEGLLRAVESRLRPSAARP